MLNSTLSLLVTCESMLLRKIIALNNIKSLGEISDRSLQSTVQSSKQEAFLTHGRRSNQQIRVYDVKGDEGLVSFDVKALLSSTFVKERTALIEDWLHQQHGDAQWKGNVKQSQSKSVWRKTILRLGVSSINS